MKILFLFLDGVGLGSDNPESNPFVRAAMPNLLALLEGKRLLASSAPLESPRASLLALDACLGVAGLPQSATGQAVLLTGQNVPAAIGYHYGPKPNPDVAAVIKNGNLFNQLRQIGKRSAYLNAFPPAYFESIRSGRRIYSAIPLAAVSAGLSLPTADNLREGQALSADFTGQGWHTHLKLNDIPILNPIQAGQRMAALASCHDFSLFEYWSSDYAGHHQDMDEACALLETFDQVLGGLLDAWDDGAGMIFLTSDHGNLEDLSTRRHTSNPVPALLIGAPAVRQRVAQRLKSLQDVVPAIISLFEA
jgi:hypothetical protein